jgi:hypothetical protein
MPDRLQRIAVLENEIEAQLLRAELAQREIPHLIISYDDSAWDGLFQFSQGWGHVEAPPEFKGQILEILIDLRQGSLRLEEDSPENPEEDSPQNLGGRT